MTMEWKPAYLDAALVPAGLGLLIVYHIYLIYRIRYHPYSTVIGVNRLNRRVWVDNIMKDSRANGVLAIQTIRNSIMASTLLASTAITLSSIIGALFGSASSGKSNIIVVGAESLGILTVKYLALSLCFLVAFVCHVQAIRYSSHVSFLITIPKGETAPGLSPEYVNRLMNRGTNFFSLGMRAYYLSFPLFLWLFGPIPYFVGCIIMVMLLKVVDTASEFNVTLSTHDDDEEKKIDSGHRFQM